MNKRPKVTQSEPRWETTTHGILALLHISRWACDNISEKSTNEKSLVVMRRALVVVTYNEMVSAMMSADRAKEMFWVDGCHVHS